MVAIPISFRLKRKMIIPFSLKHIVSIPIIPFRVGGGQASPTSLASGGEHQTPSIHFCTIISLTHRKEKA